MGQADLSVSAELTGEQQVTSAVEQMNKAVRDMSSAVQADTFQQDEHNKAVLKLSSALESQIATLKAQKTILMDPAERKAIAEAAELRIQVDNVTRSILSRVAGTRENIAMVKAETDAQEASRKAASAWRDQVQGVTEALAKQNQALLAQQQAMKSPEYQEHLAANKRLREEIGGLSRTTQAHDAVEKGVFSNMRTRREALVMAHEAMMGRTKNLMGSAMVFAEYADLSIMHTITSMINPTTIAIGAIAVATVGATVALVEMSYKAAEHFHEMSLIAAETGATTEQMLAFEHAAIGTGVSTKLLGTALEKFTVNMSKHREELERVGVTAKDPIQAFEQLMDVARNTQDPVERNRILSDALGASWRQLAPLVIKGGDALRDAIKEMRIPEDVLEDYEKINALAIENAKAWDTIKHNSQGTLSTIALGLSEVKAGFLDQAKSDGWMKTIGTALIEPPWLKVGFWGARGVEIANAATEAAKKGTASAAGVVPKEIQDILDKAHAAAAKASKSGELAEEQANFQTELRQLVQHNVNKEDLIEAHRAKIAEINARWEKKSRGKKPAAEKTDAKYGADQESARLIEQALKDESAVEKIREQTQIMNLKAAKDGIEDVAQLREIDREVEAMQLHAKYVDEQNAARGSKEKLKAIQDQYRAALRVLNAQWDAKDAADDAKEAEAYAKRLEERAKVEREANAKSFNDRTKEGVTAYKSEVSLWQSRLGIYNSSLSGMLSGDKSYHAAAREMWETTKNTAITSVLELGEKWIAEKIAMATFSDAMRAEEVAANGTQAAIIAAQDATPAALASTMSFGSAAIIGGAALAAAVAMAASFDVGTPSVQGDQLAKIHNRETILPTWASIPAQRGDWGPAQRFMGQTGGGSSTSTSTSSQTNHITIHVAGTKASAEDIARAVVRAQKIQGRTRAGTSF